MARFLGGSRSPVRDLLPLSSESICLLAVGDSAERELVCLAVTQVGRRTK